MSDDNNSENQDPRERFETQTISKLSMEFLDSVCFHIFFFVLPLQLITYFAIIIYSYKRQLYTIILIVSARLAIILIGVRPLSYRIYVINSNNTV